MRGCKGRGICLSGSELRLRDLRNGKWAIRFTSDSNGLASRVLQAAAVHKNILIIGAGLAALRQSRVAQCRASSLVEIVDFLGFCNFERITSQSSTCGQSAIPPSVSIRSISLRDCSTMDALLIQRPPKSFAVLSETKPFPASNFLRVCFHSLSFGL